MEDFLEYLKINFNKNTTIERYHDCLKRVSNFSKGEINQENVNQYFSNMTSKGMSQSSKNIARAALMSYCKFKKINIELPPNRKGESKGQTNSYITEKELENILQPFDVIFDRKYPLKRLVFRFMFYTGLRPDEVANLKSDNFDFKKERVVVHNTKGKVDRFVPLFNKKLVKDLKTYMEVCSHEFIFNVSKDQLISDFAKVKNMLNLNYDFTPKTMRHSFANMILRKGVRLEAIQKAMGHKSITTTQIYCAIDEELIETEFKKLQEDKDA